MTLFGMIQDELKHRGASYVDTYAPFYSLSMACHVFNSVNKAREIIVSGGYAVDTRLHILFVAPPGFGKSYWLQQFLRGTQSIAGDVVPCTFEGIVTEAGWVGTLKFQDDTPLIVPGVAMRHKLSIIGCQEFSGITNMFQSQHSKNLDTALLTSLDDGHVEKTLAAGTLKYETFATLQTGTQPARFDLSGGMARRFLFLEMIPTLRDKIELRNARRQARDRRFDPLRLRQIHNSLRELMIKLNSVERVRTDASVYEVFDRFNLWHFEEELFERMMLGYTLLTKPITSSMVIEMTDEAKALLEREITWRQNVSKGSQFSQAIQILRDRDGVMTMDEWRIEFLAFGADYAQSMELASRLQHLRIVTMKGNQIMLREREKSERSYDALFRQGESGKSKKA